MAKASNEIIKKQYNTARRNMTNGFILDNSNLDLIPEGNQFVALRNLTIQINSARETGRRAELVIAAGLYRAKCEIADLVQSQKSNSEAQVLLRWNDVRDYASEMFGYQKSVAYSLASVGEKFLHEDGTLKHPYTELSSCGASVLGLLTSMEDSTIFDMIDRAKDEDKRITAAFVREYKKALKAGTLDSEPESTPETPTETPTETPIETPTETPTENLNDDSITFVKPTAERLRFDVIADVDSIRVIIHRPDGDKTTTFARDNEKDMRSFRSVMDSIA